MNPVNQINIAILASGQGTTAEAFIRESVANDSNISVRLVVCNTKSAGIFQRIANLNAELSLDIQTVLINGRTHPAMPDETVEPGGQTVAEQKAILEAFNQYNIDFVTLMGYMKRVGSQIVKTWGWQPQYTSVYQARMLNTHPGLLPETKGTTGISTQAHVLAKHLPFGGQTLHIVSEDYDDGPIVAEHKIATLPTDTPDSFFEKVQTTEKKYIFEDINTFIEASDKANGMKARVLIIGSGGREHALAYGLAASPKVSSIYVSPGNAGTASAKKTQNVTLTDYNSIVAWCKQNKIDLVVIGPEAPLCDGLADKLRGENIATFGASKVAAQLEGSKSFSTEFMQRQNIPIPKSRIVTSEKEATAAINELGGPTKSVIKADGLAGGKGVFLPDNQAEADLAIKRTLSGEVDGDGNHFVIQQRNSGPEVSVFVLSDGNSYQIIPLACQDHKRLLNSDKGPNTGGMGVYAPLPSWMLSDAQWDKIRIIADKSITGMAAEGTPYQGVLYIGIMLSEELGGDPIVIEYNVRFGDPETEVIIPILVRNNVDVFDMLWATANSKLANYQLPTSLQGAALTICLAAENYPQTPKTGQVISGLAESYQNAIVFHGGTKVSGNSIVSAGGRVLYITGLGDTPQNASAAANAAIGQDKISFPNMQYRSDIAHRAFNK